MAFVGPGQIGVYGVAYDVRAWGKHHPGGEVLVRVCEGTDATALFESTHVDGAAALAALRKLPCVGTYEPSVTYDYATYRVLRESARRAYPTRASRRMAPRERAKMYLWLALAAWCHLALLLLPLEVSKEWLVFCVASALCNTVLGGYGHNAVHRLEWPAVFLDWNGLSCFEWLFEHVVSHHPHVNTELDHDALSMEPFLRWLPHRPKGLFGDAQREGAAVHLIYAVGEAVVAAQGCFGHRLRWRAWRWGAPRWMVGAPLLFVARAASLVAARGAAFGGLTFLVTLCLASYYFSYLAHQSHAHVDVRSRDFARRQLQNTVDIHPRVLPSLFLDRQKLHHLFPAIDHSRLDASRLT